jgi:hypothetical protein
MADLRIQKNTDSNKLPDGAKITKTITDNISVKQIENGYLIQKSMKVYFTRKGSDGKPYEDYNYVEKQFYSAEDPLTIKANDSSLADDFS